MTTKDMLNIVVGVIVLIIIAAFIGFLLHGG